MTQLKEREKQLAELISEECTTPAELTAKLKNLFAGALQKILEAELEEHLGYEKNSIDGNNSGNSRNGYGKKTVKSEWGESEIAIPRDRNGTFEPQIIEKRQTRTDDIETRILAMYAKGMSNRDIEDHLRDIYRIENLCSTTEMFTCRDVFSSVFCVLKANNHRYLTDKREKHRLTGMSGCRKNQNYTFDKFA